MYVLEGWGDRGVEKTLEVGCLSNHDDIAMAVNTQYNILTNLLKSICLPR